MPRWMTLVVFLSVAAVAYSAEVAGTAFSGEPRIEALVVDVTDEPLSQVGLSLCPLDNAQVRTASRNWSIGGAASSQCYTFGRTR